MACATFEGVEQRFHMTIHQKMPTITALYIPGCPPDFLRKQAPCRPLGIRSTIILVTPPLPTSPRLTPNTKYCVLSSPRLVTKHPNQCMKGHTILTGENCIISSRNFEVWGILHFFRLGLRGSWGSAFPSFFTFCGS